MPKQMINAKGDANIKHQGHTTSGDFGSNTQAKARYGQNPTKLSARKG